MKKNLKLILITVVLALIFIIILKPSYSNATSVSSIIGSIIVSTTEAKSNISGIEDVIAVILGFLQNLSGIMAAVVIAFTGFRYITADTPDFKRELKEKMLPIIIGTVLVFGAVAITNFILGVASS